MKQLNSLVTGGLQGIGFSIAKKLLDRGDNVFVFDIVSGNDERVLQMRELGIEYLQCDVSSVEAIKKSFFDLYKILESCGSKSLDLLVNNAGVARDNLALRMSEVDWDFVLDVNLKGTFFCCQQALSRMIRLQKSYVINISSIVGKTGNPGQSNYAASKAGIIALTKSLAQEYAKRNVLVNAIAPGFIKTPMTDNLPDEIKNKAAEHIPLGRFGHGDDVANLVLFLSSGDADYITGQVFDLNGGMT
jgi:3-oxoacyl-[acyl-carrier protein] reductase